MQVSPVVSDSTKVVLPTAASFSDPNFWANFVLNQGINVIVLVGFIYFIWIAYQALNGKSLDDVLGSDPPGYIDKIMLTSSGVAFILLLSASLSRNIPLAQALPRSLIICILELLMYFSFAFSLKKTVKDGIITLVELISTLITFLFALGSTYIMLVGYYEAVGALYFQLNNGSVFPKMIALNGTRIEASGVLLVCVTPILALLSTYYRINPILKAKFSGPARPSARSAAPASSTTSGATSSTTAPPASSGGTSTAPPASGGTATPPASGSTATPPASGSLPARVNTGSVHGNINTRATGGAIPPATPPATDPN